MRPPNILQLPGQDTLDNETREEAFQAFLRIWETTHDWEFNPNSPDLYETHAWKWFLAGWVAEKQKETS